MVSSVFISAIMFVVGLSILTRKFPPEFGQLQASYENLQQMQATGKGLQESLQQEIHNVAFKDDVDVAELARINSKRAELGAGLLPEAKNGEDPHLPAKSRPSQNELRAENDAQAQTRELQKQLFRLQQRVGVLEEKLFSTDERK